MGRLRLLLATLLLLPMLASLAAAQSTVPAPAPVAGTLNSWHDGGTPPDNDPARPVLVFVHGRGGSAGAWWLETAYHGPNDMYATAYANGYRTAFVNLESHADMWVNGELLHQQLVEITAHFGVERVVVITHSKGGVDANAAAAFYGAGPLIEKVITLGAPHWGTPLADLAYSTWIWWLAELLGQRTDATYVLQTGYMAWFRSQADSVGDTVPYYTIRGKKCGPFLTALWWGCIYLSGEDDGVVPLAGQQKPGATILADGRWDHDEIRMGSRTWERIAGVLQGSGGPSTAGVAGAGRPEALGNLLLRGGEVTGTAEGQPFPLESGVRKASILFYASSPDFTATLTGPDGSSRTVKMEAQVPAGGDLAGAWLGGVELAKPAVGEWRLATAASSRTGYLMVAALESDLHARLDLGAKAVAPGGSQSLIVSLNQAVQSATVDGDLSLNGGPSYATPILSPVKSGVYRTTLPLLEQEGVHNLSLTVTGALADGTAFERSLVASFAVIPSRR